MDNRLLYIPARTESMNYCGTFLQKNGFRVTFTPSMDVTDLLLPAPAFKPGGILADGQDLQVVLSRIPNNVTVIGGNLNIALLNGYQTLDLLQNEEYLARNAAITAECALRIATQELPVTLLDAPILILGWGRIGKCLVKLLNGIGCDISVAARKEADLAMISALGFHPVPYPSLSTQLKDCRIVFNTVPAEVLPADITKRLPANCRKIDLASLPGIGGNDVIHARGLPGKMAPESSGRLIGETILHYLFQQEVIT